jgi:hypothetical protein
MSLTKKQKKREEVAAMLDKLFPNNPSSKQLRATNRRIENNKGKK